MIRQDLGTILFMFEFISNYITIFFANTGIRETLIFIIAAFGFGGLFKLIMFIFKSSLNK